MDQGPAHSYQKPAFSTFSPNNTYRRPENGKPETNNANNHNSGTLSRKNNGHGQNLPPPPPAHGGSPDPNLVDIKLRTFGAVPSVGVATTGTLDSTDSSTTSGSYVVDPHELCEEIDELFFNKNKTPASPMRC